MNLNSSGNESEVVGKRRKEMGTFTVKTRTVLESRVWNLTSNVDGSATETIRKCRKQSKTISEKDS